MPPPAPPGDSRPYEVAGAIEMLSTFLIDEPRAVANTRILVHDDTVELDVPANSEPGSLTSRGSLAGSCS